MGQDVDHGQIAQRGVVGQSVGNGHEKTSFLRVMYLYLTINDISIYFLFQIRKRILGWHRFVANKKELCYCKLEN